MEHWLIHRAYKGEAPLRDFWGRQFIIMNDKLSEEFDHFRKHAIDAFLYPVEAIELLEYWLKSSGISIKTKYDKTYLLMSSANIDAFCQWILDTRKMCNEDGLTLDSVHLTSKPDLSVCASASLIIDISQPKKCSVNEAKKSMIACNEEMKKSRKVGCDDEVKQIKKSRKVACDEEVKQIKKSRMVRTQGLSNLRHQWLEVGNVILYEEHRCILESDKKWLDDAIINAVQYLLHSQYGMPGFQAGHHLTFDIMRKSFIQFLHNGEDHWFTISTLGLPSGHVHIYDSLYNTYTYHGIEQVCSILYTPNNAVHLISWMLID